MSETTNQLDKQGLRKFMQTYTRLIYNRASLRLQDHELAMQATRATLKALSDAVEHGKSHPEAVPWLMALTDNCCLKIISQSADQKTEQIPAQQSSTRAPEASPAPDEPQAVPQQPEIVVQPQAVSDMPVARAPIADRPVLSPRVRRDEGRAGSAVPEPNFTLAREEGTVVGRSSETSTLDLFSDEEEENARRAKKGRARAQQMQEEAEDEPQAGIGMVFLLFFLIIVVLALLWLLVVMLMAKGIIPNADMGFAEWFNRNIFELF